MYLPHVEQKQNILNILYLILHFRKEESEDRKVYVTG